MPQQVRPAGHRIRDAIMLVILSVWSIYAGAAVLQLFTSGAKVLESLPPFWFWGIPLGPYGALYQPWRPGAIPGLTGPPEEPQPPQEAG